MDYLKLGLRRMLVDNTKLFGYLFVLTLVLLAVLFWAFFSPTLEMQRMIASDCTFNELLYKTAGDSAAAVGALSLMGITITIGAQIFLWRQINIKGK